MPKPSLKKLWGLAAHHRPDSKEKRMDLYPNPQIDELAQAYQDMQDMKDCYDSLLSAAAATANSAYEFSESLRELGTCLLEKTALNDDEETGRVLLTLGKLQFELQKLVDGYRSHVTQTISTPSESLLNELRTVEEMKRQCDDKRVLYEHMVTTQREKGRLKNSKESFSPQQLQDAQQEYDEEATLFIFRLKSLKQGQSRSLLTQAVRHHSAQLSFFRKGIKSLEAVEPHVKLIAEKQHIDYQFSGLEDYETDSDNNDESVNDQHDANYDGELSFDYGQNEQGADVVSASRNSMELDQADHTSTAVSTMENAQENIDRSQPDSLSFRKPRPGSQSAPIFPEKKTDSTERIKEMSSSSTKRFHTYVLPTPIDLRSSTSPSPGNTAPAPSKQVDPVGGWLAQSWHSSPLEPPDKHPKKSSADAAQSNAVQSPSVLKESNTNTAAIRRPPPLAEGLPLPPSKERWDHSPHSIPPNSDPKKFKRQAFSGPLLSKGWSSKPLFCVPSVQHQVVSPIPPRVPTRPRSVSPKVSPTASPPLMPSPRMSELHELPRPPSISLDHPRPFVFVGHSGPLVSRAQDPSVGGKAPLFAARISSPLPTPPGAMSRSFSIPSSRQRSTLNAMKLMGNSPAQDANEEISSPLVRPMSLTNRWPDSTASEPALHPAKGRGG